MVGPDERFDLNNYVAPGWGITVVDQVKSPPNPHPDRRIIWEPGNLALPTLSLFLELQKKGKGRQRETRSQATQQIENIIHVFDIENHLQVIYSEALQHVSMPTEPFDVASFTKSILSFARLDRLPINGAQGLRAKVLYVEANQLGFPLDMGGQVL